MIYHLLQLSVRHPHCDLHIDLAMMVCMVTGQTQHYIHCPAYYLLKDTTT